MTFTDSFPLVYRPQNTLNDVFNKLPYQLEDIDESIEIPNSATPSHSPIFRNKSFIKSGSLLTSPDPKTKTLFDLFEQNVKTFFDSEFLGRRVSSNGPYEFLTYAKTQQQRNQLGSGILHLMNQFQANEPLNDFILSIYAPNRLEWSLLDYTCHAFSITSTALYDTLGVESINYIIKTTKTPIMFTTGKKIHNVLELVREKCHKNLKIIVSLDILTPTELSYLGKIAPDVQIYDFNQVLQLGVSNPYSLIPPSASSIFSITFTSGTSGVPKGVILTHSNLMAAILTIYTKMRIENDPRHYVSLPLAHILQRVNCFLVSIRGGKMFYPYDGTDTRTFFNDIIYCKPTHMASVPRVYNKLESIFKNKIIGAPTFANKLTQRAIEYKISSSTNGTNPKHWIYDSLIHNKLRSIVGFDNVKYFVSGAAPIHGDTLKFIKAIFNVDCFIEAYGSTETCGGILMKSGYDSTIGTVGSISPTTEFRIRDVPEMNYLFEKNRSGELLVRGPQVFQGYYKNEEFTNQAFDEDGWYMTGDIVRVDQYGKVFIIDRLKNFFKLSQGEFIAPEKIENMYISNNSDLIDQIWCYGDTLQSYIVGIVSVNVDNLKVFLKNNGMKIDDVEKLFKDLSFKKMLLKHLNSRVIDLQGFEKLKNIYIDIDPLNIENGTMTPTLKIKRIVARKVFQSEIEQLYNQGDLFHSKL